MALSSSVCSEAITCSTLPLKPRAAHSQQLAQVRILAPADCQGIRDRMHRIETQAPLHHLNLSAVLGQGRLARGQIRERLLRAPDPLAQQRHRLLAHGQQIRRGMDLGGALLKPAQLALGSFDIQPMFDQARLDHLPLLAEIRRQLRQRPQRFELSHQPVAL